MGVRVKEEEENHAEGHEIHVDQEQDPAVVEAPAALHAANGVGGTEDGDECGDDKERSGVIVREIREEDGGAQTGEHEKTAA
jgi:hypothetical protein